MATCLNKLDLTEINDKVLEYYKALMSASTEQDSLYIKAKETVTQILDEAGLDARERANILSQTIGGMVSGISAQSMQGAIDLAKDNRDASYVLAKLCADTELTNKQVEKVTADIADTEQNTNLKIANGWRVQAELYRDFGAIPDQLTYTKEVLDNTDYDTDYGTKHESIRLAQSNVYNSYTSTYRQNGNVSLVVDSDGMLNSSTTGDSEGLVYWQTRVAERNEQGFDDNMRQHVANSSATMISMLLSTEASGIDYEAYLNNWSNAITYLNTTKNETSGSISIDIIATGEISKAAGISLTGITTNISAGTSVVVYVTSSVGAEGEEVIKTSANAVGIVQIGGAWTAVVTPEMLNGLDITSTGTVSARIMDSTGIVRTDTDTIAITA